MSVSGFYGSYLVEKAERGRALRELEESTLSSLEDTDISAASRYATVAVALGRRRLAVHRLGALHHPVLLRRRPRRCGRSTPSRWASPSSVFLLGAFLGYVSRERLVLAGIRS